MKINKIIYWTATVIFCIIMVFSAGMYIMQTDTIKNIFEDLDYPSYLVIPLAVAKLLGVFMILWRKNNWLTHWAYAAFFFDLTLAAIAHYHADENFVFPLSAMVFLLISYFFGKTVRP